MSAPRQAYCLFCDDVRTEEGRKLSFMGVYGGEMVAPVPPGMPPEARLGIPKLVIAFWLITDLDDVPDRVTLTVYAPPHRSEIFKTELDLKTLTPSQTPEWATRFTIQGHIPFLNFLIVEDGIIEVTLDTHREIIVAGRVKVRLQPSIEAAIETPTVSSPPSEQSPTAVQETTPSRARRRPLSRRSGRTPEPE